MKGRGVLAFAGFGLAVAFFATMLFKHLAYPLLWQDEAEVAVFAERIVEYGYPKVHGPRNVLYEFGPNVAVGVKESADAYIGTTWGHFYFAVPGVLWAAGESDPWRRTARVRLPFALAGALGVGAMAWAVAPVFRARRRRRLRFLTLYFLLAGVSISLLLHLREARYHGMLVLLAAGIFGVHLRRTVYGTLGARAYTVTLALLLFLLFNTHFSAWFVFGALLGLDALRRRDVAGVVAVAASAVLVLPVAWWFETLSIVRAFGESLGLGPEGYLANLRGVLSHLLRHEFLAPALLCRVAVVLADRRTGGDKDAANKDRARGTAAFLLAFAAGYVLIGCLNPLVYERYFMVLSPLLTASFLIDAFTLTDLVPALAPTRRRAAALTAGALALVGVAAVAGRAPSVMGRLAEITVRYRGPLDFAIPHLASSYPHPEELVIATNYESHPFVYYLGAHLIVGLNMNNLVADRALDPDVVIVRRRWPRAQQELKRFLAKGTYLSEDLPVRDLHYNNVPALSRSPSTPDPHRFRTALAVKPAQRLRIYRKAEGVSSSRPGG